MQACPSAVGAIAKLTMLCDVTDLGTYLVAAWPVSPRRSGEGPGLGEPPDGYLHNYILVLTLSA